MKLLLEVSGQDEDKAIEYAIQAAGRAKDDQITKQVVAHIMGETDGTVKVRNVPDIIFSYFILFWYFCIICEISSRSLPHRANVKFDETPIPSRNFFK